MGNKNGKERLGFDVYISSFHLIWSLIQIQNFRILFRELNCSVPTIRRFSEFKFVDTALSKEDLADQDRENTVKQKHLRL